MNKEQRTSRLAVCLFAVLLLCGCGGEKLPEDLAAYSLDGEQIDSINVALEDEELGTHLSGMEASEEETETAPKDGKETDGESPAVDEESPAYTKYRYSGLEGPGEYVLRYVEALTAENGKYRIVDDTGTAADPPDYTRETGEVFMTKQSGEEGRLLRIEVTWEEDSLCVMLTKVADQDSRLEPESLTNSDAVEFLKGLSPASLGLPGDSMRDYQIYPIDGTVHVDGVPCLKLQVYQLHFPESSNDIVGVYLLTGDCRHLYRLEDNQVTELSVL